MLSFSRCLTLWENCSFEQYHLIKYKKDFMIFIHYVLLMHQCGITWMNLRRDGITVLLTEFYLNSFCHKPFLDFHLVCQYDLFMHQISQTWKRLISGYSDQVWWKFVDQCWRRSFFSPYKLKCKSTWPNFTEDFGQFNQI